MKGAIIHTGCRAVTCPSCAARPGDACTAPNGTPTRPHQVRINAAGVVTRDANRTARSS